MDKEEMVDSLQESEESTTSRIRANTSSRKRPQVEEESPNTEDSSCGQ